MPKITKSISKRRNAKLQVYREGKKNKEIAVYINNKPLEQVQIIKYLGIIIDGKLNLRGHIIYTAIKLQN